MVGVDPEKIFDRDDPEYHSTGYSLMRRHIVQTTYRCYFCERRWRNNTNHDCKVGDADGPPLVRTPETSTEMGDIKYRLARVEEAIAQLSSSKS
jgi:hypothetical protein